MRPIRWRPFTHWCAAHQSNPKAWPKALGLRFLDYTAEVHLNGDGWQVRWSYRLGIHGSGGDLSKGITVRNPRWKSDSNPTNAQAYATARRLCEVAIAEDILSEQTRLEFIWGLIGCDQSGNARDRRRKRRDAVRTVTAWARNVLSDGER
jgi:hypothetical protein